MIERSSCWYGFRPVVLSAGVVGIFAVLFNVASLVVHALFAVKKLVYGASIFSIVVISISLIWLFLDAFVLHLKERGLYNKLKRPHRFRAVIIQILLVLNLLSLIVTVVELAAESNALGIDDPGIRKHEVTITVIDSFCVVFNSIFCMLVCQLTFWPVYRGARSILLMSGVIQFIIGTLIIVLNYQSSLYELYPKKRARFSFFQHVGSLEVAVSILSIGLSSVFSEGERLNKTVTRFVSFYLVFSTICMIIALIFFGMALRIVAVIDPPEPDSDLSADVTDIFQSNPPLAAVALCLHILTMVAAGKLQKTPPSYLAVEEIDLNSLTTKQLEAYANLIDTYNKHYPGAPRGREALSLMTAYSNITGHDNLSCVVLRVYQPKADDRRENRIRQWAFEKYIPQSYDEISAWKNLDRGLDLSRQETEIGYQSTQQEQQEQQEQDQEQQPAQISKNKLKRMQKKKNKGKKKEDCINFPLETPKSAEEIQREIEFNTKLMSTEALVLLTRIESYDLTGTLTGKFGSVIQSMFGSKSRFKLLCVRLGVLGFHWPFRQATFYCGKSRRPVARSAAILRAIIEWNKALPSSERCTVHLDPKYEEDFAELAIKPSGWNRVRLPHSHIIDLRPYKNKTVYEYLKAIKYRNQDSAFKRANGQVVESDTFTKEECAEIIDLWWKIAEKRTGEGHTAVLADPTPSVIEKLGKDEYRQSHYRTLLFLKVDGKTIASCVLFRLGDTITSDLQGLDQDLSKTYKAYFVMMQETINIALKEGISFVDFGPTTSEAKVHIGAKSTPLKGGMHATSTPLNLAIKIAAQNVNSG
jgi:hypothetical protein